MHISICTISSNMNYQLPTLPYEYHSFEPIFSQEMIQIHHMGHHAAYVNKLNQLIESISSKNVHIPTDLLELYIWAKHTHDIDESTKKQLLFNIGGHYNHTFLWEILSPRKQNNNTHMLSPELIHAINRQFHSFEHMQSMISSAAMSILGIGWAWLCASKEQEPQLLITTTSNHEIPTHIQIGTSTVSVSPLLTIDMWEHAYYLKYKNKKAEYIDAYWNIINWEYISFIYQKMINK